MLLARFKHKKAFTIIMVDKLVESSDTVEALNNIVTKRVDIPGAKNIIYKILSIVWRDNEKYKAISKMIKS